MIEIKVTDENVVAAFNRLIALGEDMEPVMRDIAGILQDAVEQNFEEQGRPKWESLGAATLKLKAKRGKTTPKILQDTGRLAASITARYDADSATVGTNVLYAAIHQFGGQAGRGHKVTIPARPYLPITPDGHLANGLDDEITSILRGAIENALVGR